MRLVNFMLEVIPLLLWTSEFSVITDPCVLAVNFGSGSHMMQCISWDVKHRGGCMEYLCSIHFITVTEELVQVNMAACSMLNCFYCFRRLRSGDDPTIPAPWSGEKTSHANYGPQKTHSGPYLARFQPDIT